MGENSQSRRHFLYLAGTGVLVSTAGCASQQDSSATEIASSTTSAETATQTATPTATATETATPEETTTETPQSSDGPGYIQDHWHGRLFFEINGELVDFDRSKYYLDNIEEENPETVYFHFHEDEDAHGPNEWSNEKKIITLAHGLNLFPEISYERSNRNHVIGYEGTTYHGGDDGTSISIYEGTGQIDPTAHQVAHNENYYVKITTQDSKRDVDPSHDAELGTLLFDINNIRLDFSQPKFLEDSTGAASFHFHEDQHPFLWYREGEVTLQAALNSLPGITYRQTSGGSHIIEYDGKESYSMTYDETNEEDELVIRQRTTDIDPTTYSPESGDIIWVYVHSQRAPENEH